MTCLCTGYPHPHWWRWFDVCENNPVPDCCGCASHSELCCCNHRCHCKPHTPWLMPNASCEGNGMFCVIGLGLCSSGVHWRDCKQMHCCMFRAQSCCLFHRAICLGAGTDKIPAVITCAGVTCFPECGCCQPLGELTGELSKGEKVELLEQGQVRPSYTMPQANTSARTSTPLQSW